MNKFEEAVLGIIPMKIMEQNNEVKEKINKDLKVKLSESKQELMQADNKLGWRNYPFFNYHIPCCYRYTFYFFYESLNMNWPINT